MSETPNTLATNVIPGTTGLFTCTVCGERLNSGGICHHCHQCFCQNHIRGIEGDPAFNLPKAAAWQYHLGLDTRVVPLPNLTARENEAFKAMRCERHAIQLKSRTSAMFKAGALGIGLLVLSAVLNTQFAGGNELWQEAAVLAVVMLGILALISAVSHLIIHLLEYVRRSERPGSFPLMPSLDIAIQERLSAEFQITNASLDGGEELMTDPRSSGHLEIHARFQPQDRLAAERLKGAYGIDADDLDWDLGFAVLESVDGVRFPEPLGGPRENQIRLQIPRSDQRPKLIEWVEKGDATIFEMNYAIEPSSKEEAGSRTFSSLQFPFVLVPFVEPKSGNVFRLKLLSAISNEELEEAKLERLTVNVPLMLSVDMVEEGGRFHGEKDQIVWTGIDLSQTQIFSFGCKENILEALEDNDSLEGTFIIRLPRTCSNISLPGDGVFGPNGAQRTSPGVRIRKETLVSGSFRVEAGALSYQKEFTESDRLERTNMIPDFNTIQEVVAALGEASVSVTRVTDNPPTTDSKSANVRHRYWDIMGSRLTGAANLFPVRVHIVVSGEEHYQGGTHPNAGTTLLETTVRTMVHDETSQEHAESACREIQHIVSSRLFEFTHPLVGHHVDIAKAPPAQASEEVSEPAASPAPPQAAPVGTRNQREEFEQLIETLQRRFLEGSVSESTYLSLREELQAKLAAVRD